jgi:hypothetical protein
MQTMDYHARLVHGRTFAQANQDRTRRLKTGLECEVRGYVDDASRAFAGGSYHGHVVVTQPSGWTWEQAHPGFKKCVVWFTAPQPGERFSVHPVEDFVEMSSESTPEPTAEKKPETGEDKSMISSFTGRYRFLSNFYPSPVKLDPAGRTYRSIEHGYHAAKFADARHRTAILALPHPRDAGRYARKHRNQVCANWDQLRLLATEDLLRQKFSPGSALALSLLGTSPQALVESNQWHDSYWGSCTCGECPHGSNHLGKLLMKIRLELEVASKK